MKYGGILFVGPMLRGTPFNWEKISSTFGMGQINFHVTLFIEYTVAND